MKRSEKPTEFVLILADTGSEWDTCDFAIFQINDEWRSVMRQRLACLERFASDDNFCSLRYWESPIGFYRKEKDDEADITEGILKTDEVWCYVTLDEGETDGFPMPESKLNTYMLCLYQSGTATYNASGKHTGEEFWTEGFDISQLIPAGTAASF
jgi:hypothetical protein